VQRAGAAEGHQREAARVVALLDRDQAQRAEHVFVDDIDYARCRFHQTDPERRGGFFDRALRRPAIEFHLAAEQIDRQITEHQVGVGNRGLRAAAAIGRRTGLGSRALGSDPQRARERGHLGDRPAACANRPHIQR
jgi:hypothetical protein